MSSKTTKTIENSLSMPQTSSSVGSSFLSLVKTFRSEDFSPSPLAISSTSIVSPVPVEPKKSFSTTSFTPNILPVSPKRKQTSNFRNSPIFDENLFKEPPMGLHSLIVDNPHDVIFFEKEENDCVKLQKQAWKDINKYLSKNYCVFFASVLIYECYSNGSIINDKIHFKGCCYIHFNKNEKPRPKALSVELTNRYVAKLNILTKVKEAECSFRNVFYHDRSSFLRLINYEEDFEKNLGPKPNYEKKK